MRTNEKGFDFMSYTMTDRTPAEFQAARKRVGASCSDLAHALGIEVRTVRRWESPSSPAVPFDQAWDLLDGMMQRRTQAIDAAIDELEMQEQERGGASVTLTIWPSDAAWSEAHPGEQGSARFANSVSCAVADVAEALGYTVEWAWPETDLVKAQRQRAAEIVARREESLRRGEL